MKSTNEDVALQVLAEKRAEADAEDAAQNITDNVGTMYWHAQRAVVVHKGYALATADGREVAGDAARKAMRALVKAGKAKTFTAAHCGRSRSHYSLFTNADKAREAAHTARYEANKEAEPVVRAALEALGLKGSVRYGSVTMDAVDVAKLLKAARLQWGV